MAIKCVAEGFSKPTVDLYRNGKKLNVTNCHTKSTTCDKVAYEVYEEGDGSSGLHTIFTVLKIRRALYPRDTLQAVVSPGWTLRYEGREPLRASVCFFDRAAVQRYGRE